MAMVRPDQTVGLLGGSFDPPHAGHVHITLEALKRFELHQIWWLVSPGNPLKAQGPAPMAKRMAAARKLMDHQQVTISDYEARAGTQATADTLAALMAQHPGVKFVWLMGADNLAQMHRWQRWQWIMDTVPVGVLARPGSGAAARASPAAKRYDNYRLSGDRAAQLAGMQAPAWCFVDLPMVDLSSSAIRKRGDWAG